MLAPLVVDRGDRAALDDGGAGTQSGGIYSLRRSIAAIDVDAADRLDRDAFVARFGGVFEESPWIAARRVGAAPVRERRRAARGDGRGRRARAASDDRLALIRAHPDLAARRAIAAMTPESTREQAAAGLDRLTPRQYERITALTAAYRERFGFPFIVCAREHTPDTIIAAAEARAGADPDEEERPR